MKQSYFPYLPNSRIEDNKRYKYIRDMMEKNPFTYHKRKNISFNNNYNTILDNQNQNKIMQNDNISITNNIDNSNGNNINQELLFFQKANDNYIDSYNSFMKQKSSTIENNAQRYLNYITNNKSSFNNKKNLLRNDEEFNNNLNNNLPINNELKGRKTNLYEKTKSAIDINAFPLINNNEYNNQTIEVDKRNFIPSNIKARGSDITNPFFYDCIAKEIIRKNQETMDYNLKESENKFNKKKKLSKYSEDKLAIAPGKINNPKYYNLGESSLDKNPILNKGEYTPSFSRNYKYFSRQPNIFDI